MDKTQNLWIINEKNTAQHSVWKLNINMGIGLKNFMKEYYEQWNK